MRVACHMLLTTGAVYISRFSASYATCSLRVGRNIISITINPLFLLPVLFVESNTTVDYRTNSRKMDLLRSDAD